MSYLRGIRRLRPAGWAWIGLAAYVVVIDSLLLRKHKTHGLPYCSMSEAFGDMLRHPAKRWPVTAVWTMLTLHLFGYFLPGPPGYWSKFDPLTYVVRVIDSI